MEPFIKTVCEEFKRRYLYQDDDLPVKFLKEKLSLQAKLFEEMVENKAKELRQNEPVGIWTPEFRGGYRTGVMDMKEITQSLHSKEMK